LNYEQQQIIVEWCDSAMRALTLSAFPPAILTVLLLTGNTCSGDDAMSLTKNEGPWMVQARVFRGHDAGTYARILAKELREDYGLSAYTYRDDQAPFEQISVLVGNSKIKDDAKLLVKHVRKIDSKRLVGIFPASLTTLKNARITTNPLRGN
jgi:hypothetical protein